MDWLVESESSKDFYRCSATKLYTSVKSANTSNYCDVCSYQMTGSNQDAELDEAHCLQALCSHPSCWMTEQRCARGIPRHHPAPVRTCAPKERDLPSLSIVNASEWVGQRSEANEGASLNDVICVSFTKQSKDSEITKRADLSFPGSNRSFPSISNRSFPSIPTNQAKKMVKLNTICISPLIGCSELPQCPVVMWNPNPQHIPQAFNQNKSPQVAIKELICPTLSKPLKVTADKRSNWQVQRRQNNLRQRFSHHKWRDQRCGRSTLEGAGTPQLDDDRWVGTGFNLMPQITPHHLSRSLVFNGCGSLDHKLPSLTTPNPKHSSSSLSSVLSLSLRSMKC